MWSAMVRAAERRCTSSNMTMGSCLLLSSSRQDPSTLCGMSSWTQPIACCAPPRRLTADGLERCGAGGKPAPWGRACSGGATHLR